MTVVVIGIMSRYQFLMNIHENNNNNKLKEPSCRAVCKSDGKKPCFHMHFQWLKDADFARAIKASLEGQNFIELNKHKYMDL